MDDISVKLSAISPDAFERLCCALLRRDYPEYAGIEPGYNALGKTRKGTPDAHVQLPDDTYVAFQFTTQQTDVRKKVVGDIDKLASDRCHFHSKISEVVICLNTPLGSEIESYREHAASHGWRLQVLSLERLTHRLAKHPDLCERFLGIPQPAPRSQGEAERLFDCGKRVRSVRTEIGLRVSEFVDAIGFSSERAFKRIEQQQDECPQSTLRAISTFCGVSLEWLQFARGTRYLTDYLTIYNLAGDITRLQVFDPQHLYFCMDRTTYHVLVVAEVSEYRWQVFDTGITLDFWQWIDDLAMIPKFQEWLNALHEKFILCSSRILPARDLEDLLNGQRHARVVIRGAKPQGRYWAEDLTDIDHERSSAPEYTVDYGKWFVRAQECMRRYQNPENVRRGTAKVVGVIAVPVQK